MSLIWNYRAVRKFGTLTRALSLSRFIKTQGHVPDLEVKMQHFTRQFGERVDRHGQVLPLHGKFTGGLIDEIASETRFMSHQTMTVLWKGRIIHKFNLRGKVVPQEGDPIPEWVQECIREKQDAWPHCRLVWWRGQRRSDPGIIMEW